MSNSHPLVQDSQGVDADAAAALIIDQAALNFTQSQAGTAYANSLLRTTGGSTIWDDDSSASVYSYDTTRDASKFLKEVEGRVSTLQYHSNTSNVNIFHCLRRLMYSVKRIFYQQVQV
jgi:hypothetical protein